MELTKCMKERRSIRKYQQKEVSHELIRELIEAAILAPSWKNSQVSRYYVVDGQKKKDFMTCLPEFNQNNTKDAPTLIISTVVKGRSGFEKDGSYTTHLKDGFQYFDNGLQVQNICLKAYELGLGTLVMGIYDDKKVREFLEIGEEETVVAIIAVGYPDIDPVMPKRKTVEDILTFK